MFNNLTNKLSDIFSKLTNRGSLSESDVVLALREVRVALIEADVSLSVAKDFIEQVKEKAVGKEVLDSVTPGQMVIKIVHDHLVKALGGDDENSTEKNSLIISDNPPTVIMMVGLQGSGKTTTSAKLGYLLKNKKKKVLLCSTDIYRPAAREQLQILGKKIDIDTLDIIAQESPLEITKRANNKAKLEGYDVLIVDTAGRLHIDDELMNELQNISKIVNPIETLLVADSMTGQDAVNIAQSFKEKIDLTGVILSRIDGDSRGGAALSMRSITKCPIKFLGNGEDYNNLEVFYPERIASRILNMGDVVSLVEKAQETIDEKQADKLSKRMERGLFDLSDMSKQLSQVSKMGGMSSIISMLPGINKMQDKINNAGFDDNLIKRQVAIISSMTKKERKYYKLLNASRKKRIASGSGSSIEDINKLLKQYKDMLTAMKRLKKMGKKGMMSQGLSSLLQ